MGVILTTGLVLGAFAAFIELRIGLGTFMRELIAKSAMLGIVFSLALSLAIGSLFGAAGVTVMVIAVVCMTITQPVYMVYNKIRSTGHDVANTIEEVKDVFRPFIRMFKLGFKLIALPFIIIYKVVKFIDRLTSPKAA